VDDERKYCDIVAKFLRSQGYEVRTAYDVGDALFRLKAELPDLILLDVMMPEVDGITFLGKLRSNPEWARIPVVIVSAKTLPEDRSLAINVGADHFLPKPFSAQQLRMIVGDILPAIT
jgi:DNA-binding response OmpR family regulator